MKMTKILLLAVVIPMIINAMEVPDIYEEVGVGLRYLFQEAPLPQPEFPCELISQLAAEESAEKKVKRRKDKDRMDYWHLKMGSTLKLENDGGDINLILGDSFGNSDFMRFYVQVKSNSYKELDAIDILREEDDAGNITVKTVHNNPLSSRASILYNVLIPTYPLSVHAKTTNGTITLSCIKEKLAELTATTVSGSIEKPSFVSQDMQRAQKYFLTTTTGNIVVKWKEN